MAGRNWVLWRDLEPAARLAFDVPYRDAAVRWAEFAWKAAGQNDTFWDTYLSELERTTVCIRGMALLSYYLDWCAMAWEEARPDDLVSWAVALNVSPICAGQLLGGGVDVAGDCDRALRHLVGAARGEVVDRLHRNLTSDYHFGMLALSRELQKVDENWMFPFERMGEFHQQYHNGWEWLREGCPAVQR
jgi:hypothetical protein